MTFARWRPPRAHRPAAPGTRQDDSSRRQGKRPGLARRTVRGFPPMQTARGCRARSIRSSITPTITTRARGSSAVAEQSVKNRVFAAAGRISATANPTVATVREAAGVSNADAGRFLKEWRAERDSAGSKIAATPATITEHALRLAGTVWEEAVRAATAEHAVIEKAWRDESAHKDREINELATDLDAAARNHEETVTELQTRVEEANQAARDNAASAAEAREQLAVTARKHAGEVAGLKSQLAEARATATTLQQTQDALIARIDPHMNDREGK